MTSVRRWSAGVVSQLVNSVGVMVTAECQRVTDGCQMIAQRTKDHLRELLFPVTIAAIVGSLYALAMAQSHEAIARRDSGKGASHERPAMVSIDLNE